jgi:glycosyltransferase involved in cell wall biosynthesis
MNLATEIEANPGNRPFCDPDAVLPKSLTSLRVAIVHYWFVGRAGGEHVVEALADIFPQADLFTLIADPLVMSPSLRRRTLTTSFLQRIPFVHRFHRHTLLLQPFALEQFDLTGYDLVISSESGPAKGVLTSPQSLHVCYCHSPMRYLWDMYPRYSGTMAPVTRLIFGLTAHALRLWDYASAARVDTFVTNSKFVASRIRKFYGRDATVIYPPVHVKSVAATDKQEDFYLAVGRLVDYKRFDLAIGACNRLNRPLKIIGSGPEYKHLKKLAGPSVQFLGAVSDEEKHREFGKCRALLFPGEEDFGMVAVEAQAHGRPVIGYGSGGILETVVNLTADRSDLYGPTGLYFQEQSVAAVEEAILNFERHASLFDPAKIRIHAMQFDSSIFRDKMISFLSAAIADHEMGVVMRLPH